VNRAETLATASAALETLYTSRPSNLAEQLTPIQQQLTAVRDDIRRERQRGEGDSSLLGPINQAVSLLHAAAYRAGAVDWQYLEQARDLIKEP
jgi:hypothetical protein